MQAMSHPWTLALRMKSFSCHVLGRCSLPLGLEDKRIVDGGLSASTFYNHNLAPWLGRINSIRSWSARVNNARQWLQIDFGNVARVTGIATQGRRDAHQWVTRYVLSYGDGTNFRAYRERRQIRVSEPLIWFGWLYGLIYKMFPQRVEQKLTSTTWRSKL